MPNGIPFLLEPVGQRELFRNRKRRYARNRPKALPWGGLFYAAFLVGSTGSITEAFSPVMTEGSSPFHFERYSMYLR